MGPKKMAVETRIDACTRALDHNPDAAPTSRPMAALST
jgi:hypothetical protein